MQFLDAIGLAYFWKKIKNWVNINYLSLTGGTIRGSVSFFNEADGGKSIRIDPSNITNSKYGVNYLFASGKMIPIGEANGVAGLDSNGCVPLDQLGNLDTTVAEVVTALPTTNIKKHIYLIKDASGVTQNQYEEYIYTGDTSATYDASKWEKLGDFRATVDLADYAKKKEITDAISLNTEHIDQNKLRQYIDINFPSGERTQISILEATTNMSGFMSYSDKNKLDNIEINANNYSLPLATNSTRGGIQVGYAANGKNYPVQLAGEKAYVNVPWTDTTYDLSSYAKKSESINHVEITQNEEEIELDLRDINDTTITLAYINTATESEGGIMSSQDKVKFNSIADGATADSAITITEIDALFV